jgi:tRNA(Ile)-lysidine synthase
LVSFGAEDNRSRHFGQTAAAARLHQPISSAARIPLLSESAAQNMPSLNQRFIAYIQSKNLFQPGDPVLLAVSGGVDSMVMLQLFIENNFRFAVAHVNYGLRGKESEEDEKLVRRITEKNGRAFFSTRLNPVSEAAEKKISLQMAARDLRYGYFETVRKENGFHRIATAHHLDDSVETVLLHQFRGTGIHGLKGIPAINGKVIRPLLCFFKEEVVELAREKKLAYREDASNEEGEYDRNKIRLYIIPAIEKHFPAFKKSFAENIEKWREAGQLYDESLGRWLKKTAEPQGAETRISIPKLKLSPAEKTILFESLKHFGFNANQVNQMIAATEPGKKFESETHRLIKDRNQLIVSEKKQSALSHWVVEQADRQLKTEKFILQLSAKEVKNFTLPADSSIGCLDKSRLEFPLLIRRWRKGDYFYPLGMKKKKKKISDYLVDRKVAVSEKENIWVVQSGNHIACIIGERIDDRFKVTPLTEVVYVIEKK